MQDEGELVHQSGGHEHVAKETVICEEISASSQPETLSDKQKIKEQKAKKIKKNAMKQRFSFPKYDNPDFQPFIDQRNQVQIFNDVI